MKIKPGIMAILILVVLFGSVAGTSAVGFWKTTTDKIPAKYASGEAAGEYNPLDIKGSYDFATISEVFEVPLADLGKAFLIPESPALGAFQVKTLEETWGAVAPGDREIGTDSVRLFVAFYKGLPIEMSESTGLPGAAVDILMARGMATSEQQAFMLTHRVEATPVQAGDDENQPGETAAAGSESAAIGDPTAEGGEPSEEERKVKGTTTWKEVVDWGVSKADLESLAGGEIKSLSSLIKDDCAARGLEFSSIKTEIQSLLDAQGK